MNHYCAACKQRLTLNPILPIGWTPKARETIVITGDSGVLHRDECGLAASYYGHSHTEWTGIDCNLHQHQEEGQK